MATANNTQTTVKNIVNLFGDGDITRLGVFGIDTISDALRKRIIDSYNAHENDMVDVHSMWVDGIKSYVVYFELDGIMLGCVTNNPHTI
jgi:hypothetical protein